jgi:hypothetical protein
VRGGGQGAGGQGQEDGRSRSLHGEKFLAGRRASLAERSWATLTGT